MKLGFMKNKLLFAEFYLGMNSTNIVLRDPPQFLSFLQNHYPQHKKWIKPGIFNTFEKHPDGYTYTKGTDSASNITGQFIKRNLQTSVTVIEGRCTAEKLMSHLAKGRYTHLGCSVRSNDLSNFIRCIKIVREKYPHIIIIVGNVGAHHIEVTSHVDYVCNGRGVPFLRELLEEDKNAPYNMAWSPYDFTIQFKNNTFTRKHLLLITKTGCPHQCDFCATYTIYGGVCSGELVEPEKVYELLVNYRKLIGNRDFVIHLAEPTAVISKDWWYELFEYFEHEKGDYPIIAATTSNSLKDLNLERLSHSAMRFELLHFGIENFTHDYSKNNGIDYDKLMSRYRLYGINIYTSYIVGYPWQNEEMIWEEIENYSKLKSSWWDIQNLKIYPGTSMWDETIDQGRFVDIPHDFRVMHGFQPFRHDHFKVGFDDMWPLLYRIYKYMEAECGPMITNYYEVMRNLVNIHETNGKIFKRTLKLYQHIAKEIYPAWKHYFKPTTTQKHTFLEKCEIA
jgi:hypothetical protein